MERKNMGRASSVPGGLIMGAGIGVGTTIMAAAAMALLIHYDKMKWEAVGYGIMVTLLAASFMGSKMTYGKVRRQKLLVCMLTGVAYYGILALMTALLFGGQFAGAGVSALLILAGSGSAALLGSAPGRGGRSEKRGKYR